MRVAFVRHDPFGPVLAGFFRPAFRPVGATAQPKAEAEALPAPVDVVDKGDRFVVKVDLPGVGKEEINVAVDGTRVSVNATARTAAQSPAAPEQITILRAERGVAKYARTVQLPVEVDADAAEAGFANGVLTLTLPKRVQTRQIVVR
jgi:HSP20 family protein